ncbi:hypothetical protein [Deinococcus sp. S9]|uniref:hypothetical protein n=1 Tax=Deinococcus sp. S9 TaxID=2545754 RepID=UPI00105572E2|nr:hypothetical protein [Deinococcus sp. S9]TDE87362.1 hypothetical protein E0686_02395 [Deinococcus sp. S9]
MSEIIRRQKGRDNPFAQIPRILLQNEELTFAARGLMAYVLSRPDDWTVMVCDLINQSPSGRDAVRSILRELQDYGYIHRARIRVEGGRFTWVSTVYDDPRDNPNRESKNGTSRCRESESANSSDSTHGFPVLGESRPKGAAPQTGFPSVAEPSAVNPSVTGERTTEKEKDRDISSLRSEAPVIGHRSSDEAPSQDPPSQDATTEAPRANESVAPDIRVPGGRRTPIATTSLAAALKARKPGGNRMPANVSVQGESGNGEQVAGSEQAHDESKATSLAGPNTPVARPPSSPNPKKTREVKRDAYKDAIAIACFGTVEGHTTSEWKAIQSVKAELTGAGVSIEDMRAIVAWMRTGHWKDKPVAPKSIPYQVSKWRAEQKTSSGGQKVHDYLSDKYGKDSDLFD